MLSLTIRLAFALFFFAAILGLFLILAHVASGCGVVGMAIGFGLVVIGGWQAAEVVAEVMSA